MKKVLLFLVLIAVTACSSIDEPDIVIKNNMILHDGFELKIPNFRHDFLVEVKAKADYDISRITYKLMIPNYKDLWGTYIPEKRIILREKQDFTELRFLSDETSYFELCEQMNAMFKSKDDVFSMKMDLEFITSKNEKIFLKNVEVKIKSSTLWDNLRNFVIENGCKVTSLPAFINIVKSIIGG